MACTQVDKEAAIAEIKALIGFRIGNRSPAVWVGCRSRDRSPVPPQHRCRPGTRGETLGTPLFGQPRPSLARSGKDDRGPQSSRPRLQLVHRRLRHTRPQGCEGAPRRTVLSPLSALSSLNGHQSWKAVSDAKADIRADARAWLERTIGHRSNFKPKHYRISAQLDLNQSNVL